MARIDGGGSSSADAAAEAQRRAAEEAAKQAAEEAAKKAAEEAKRAADAARKAAEDAAKKASEANKIAAEAKKNLDGVKAAMAKSPDDPKSTKAAETKIDQAQKAYDAASAKAKEASGTAAQLADKAVKSDAQARSAMNTANAAFKAAGRPPPFKNVASFEQKFDTGFARKADNFAKIAGLNANDPNAASKTLQDEQNYAKLAGNPENASKLQQLGVKDGSTLSQLNDKLNKLGLTTDDLMKAGKDALPDLQKAAESAVGGNWGDAAKHLEDAGKKGAVDLAKSAIEGLAKQHLSGPAKEILSDPKVVDQIFAKAPGTIEKLANGQVGDAIKGITNDKTLRDSVIDAAMKDPGFSKGVTSLGLNAADLKQAGDAVPSLIDAGTKAAQGDFKGAVASLADGAKAAPDVVSKGIQAAASHLPDGIAKTVLSDKGVADQLAKAGPDAIKTALNDPFQAVKDVAGNKGLRDSVVDAAMKDPSFSAGVAKLGMNAADLKQAGDALPNVVDAAQKAASGDWKGAITSLADGAKKAPDAVAKGIQAAAKNLPDGIAKTVLTDPAVAAQLAKAGPDTIKTALNDPFQAVKDVAGNKGLRDSVVDAAMKDPKFSAGVAKLGLNASDLKQAGDALPSVIDAAQKAAGGDWKGAISSLADGAKKAPDVVAKGIQAAAKNLPDGVAKTVLTDPKVAAQLAKAGPDTIKTALNDPFQAVKDVAGNKGLRDSVVDAAMKDPKFADSVGKLGLNASDLKQVGDALPSVIDAAQKAASGDWKGAAISLADGAKNAPDVIAKGLKAVAGKLPDGVAKTILTDDKVAAQLAKAGPDAIKTALTEGPEAALKQFAGNKDLRDSLVDAAMKDPSFAKKVGDFGLDAKDLKQLGDGLPKMFDAFDKAKAGDWKGALSDVADAAGKAPDVLSKAVQAAGSKLPDGIAKTILTDPNVANQIAKSGPDAVKAFLNGGVDAGLEKIAGNKDLRNAVVDAAMKDPGFAKGVQGLGLNADDLKKAGDALPNLVKAGESLASGDVKGALNNLADAAGKAPDVVAKSMAGVASKLPDGLAKTILTDPNVTGQLAKGMPGAIKDLANGDYQKALTSIAGNKDLRNAVIDASFKDKGFADQMGKLGLNANDLKQGADALPDVFKAAQDVAKGNFSDAVGDLRNAVAKAPDLAQKAVQGLGKALPEGSLARQLLTDPNVSKDLISDPKFQDSIGQILKGDVLGGLSGILNNDGARNDVLKVVGNNADVKAALNKVGLDPNDLVQAGAAAPHIINAMKDIAAGPQNWQSAIDEFKQAGQAAPELLQKVGTAIYNKLPDNIKAGLSKLNISEQDIRQGAAALPSLIDAGQKAASGDWKGAINSVMDAGTKAPDLSTKLLQKLGDSLPSQFGLAKSLLQDPNVAKSLATDPKVHDAIGQMLDGKVMDGVSTLLHDDSARDAVLKVVANDPAISGALQKLGLNSQDLVQAGAAAPHIFDAVKGLTQSPPDWKGALDQLGQAAGAAPDLLNKIGNAIYQKLPASVQQDISKLGLTPDDLREAGQALPHIINAAGSIAKGDAAGALKELGGAIQSAPDLVTKAVNGVASKLPDGLAKTILTDPKTVKDLLTNPDLSDAASKLFAGDAGGALKEAAQALAGKDSPLMKDIATDVMKDPALAAKLNTIGINNADDLVKLGGAIGDGFKLVDDLANKNWGQAVQDLGAVAKDIPQDMRDKLIDSIGTKLGLKPEMKEVLAGVVDAMSNPDVSKAIGDAFNAFKSGNPVDWIKGLAHAGEVIASQDKQLAVGFLDTLSHLPGSVGAFFSDHTLNQEMVDSGSMTHMFTAVEKVASGDIAGAVGELGSAFGSLLTMGKHFQVGEIKDPIFGHTIWGPKELPIGEQGLDAVGRLMKQFVAAMPDKVKTFLEEKIASVVASTGFKSIPVVGPIAGMVDDGINLYKDFTDSGHNGLDTALDAASLVVDGASIFPPFEAAATPLKVIIGIGKGINDTVQFVQGIQDFGKEFTGMN
jgi:hypothetical protein